MGHLNHFPWVLGSCRHISDSVCRCHSYTVPTCPNMSQSLHRFPHFVTTCHIHCTDSHTSSQFPTIPPRLITEIDADKKKPIMTVLAWGELVGKNGAPIETIGVPSLYRHGGYVVDQSVSISLQTLESVKDCNGSNGSRLVFFLSGSHPSEELALARFHYLTAGAVLGEHDFVAKGGSFVFGLCVVVGVLFLVGFCLCVGLGCGNVYLKRLTCISQTSTMYISKRFISNPPRCLSKAIQQIHNLATSCEKSQGDRRRKNGNNLPACPSTR